MIQWLKRRSTLNLEITQLKKDKERLKSQCRHVEQARLRRKDKNLSDKSIVGNAQDALDLLSSDSYMVAYCDLAAEYEREIFMCDDPAIRERIYIDMIALQRVTSKLNNMIKFASIRPAKAA